MKCGAAPRLMSNFAEILNIEFLGVWSSASCCGVEDVAKMICILSHSSWGRETTSGQILGFLNFDIDTVKNTQYLEKGACPEILSSTLVLDDITQTTLQ